MQPVQQQARLGLSHCQHPTRQGPLAPQTGAGRGATLLKVWATVALACLVGCQQTSHRRQPEVAVTPNLESLSAVAETSSTLSADQKADVQLAMALALERQGRAEQAIRAYRQIAKGPGSATALHRLAVLQDRQGRFAESAEYYEQALRENPQGAELLVDYGYSLYLQGKWQESEAQLRKAVQLVPGSARAQNNLGLVLARNGQFDAALAAFSATAASTSEARVNLAYALFSNDRPDEARKQLQTILKTRPDFAPARNLQAVIDRRQELLASHDAPSVKPIEDLAVVPAAARKASDHQRPPVRAAGKPKPTAAHTDVPSRNASPTQGPTNRPTDMPTQWNASYKQPTAGSGSVLNYATFGIQPPAPAPN